MTDTENNTFYVLAVSTVEHHKDEWPAELYHTCGTKVTISSEEDFREYLFANSVINLTPNWIAYDKDAWQITKDQVFGPLRCAMRFINLPKIHMQYHERRNELEDFCEQFLDPRYPEKFYTHETFALMNGKCSFPQRNHFSVEKKGDEKEFCNFLKAGTLDAKETCRTGSHEMTKSMSLDKFLKTIPHCVYRRKKQPHW
eukprot:CAMPEP_0184481494 /NCGR_PEP_ID=MMETSP0113_2-20130426/3040_1 /TAXON_ID=91329 /ORGANISM="Norrisiella sphaerica, Strain BC52" /LENGTH=198 /DNA_ID=CAMNT_0026860651 /DNA_START=486 /DNA_END=1079 /DNA_ORIENTATION=-